MAVGAKYYPSYINMDVYEGHMPANAARFIKNLIYTLDDTSEADASKGGQGGAAKPIESTLLYIDSLTLPEGYCQSIGAFSFKELKQVFVFVYNENSNHVIYRLNGSNKTYNIVKQGPVLNFQLNPENFIHQGGCWVESIFITDPATGERKRRTFLMFTDGINYQRQIAVEDAIDTNGFDPTLFPYFKGNYDPAILINMGVSTPSDCIGISEVTPTPTSTELNNNILFNTWQFRLRDYDVWGRPSEYGIISDIYIPSQECITNSSNLARCLSLLFEAPPPHINQVEIAYRNCNDQQWSSAETIDLYVGSPLGEWWKRQRNPKVAYDPISNKITYQFCADKGCNPISPSDTNRVSNPQPKKSIGVSKIGSFISLENNTDGFLPLSQNLRDKITVKVIPPASGSGSFASATILVEIFNPFNQSNQPIFRQGISADQPLAYGFGNYGSGSQYRAFFAYKQYFKNTSQQGFAGYLSPSIFTISKQFQLNVQTGEFTEVTDFTNLTNDHSRFRYFQKFEFNNIPKGKYIFRIASHQSDPTEPNWRSTSTYTAGVFGFNFSNRNNPVDHGLQVSSARELTIDVCNSNYDSTQDSRIMVIWDMNSQDVAVNQGYVYNTDDTTLPQFGVELMRLDGGELPFQPRTTDHNGFYFAASRTNRFRIQLFGYCSCVLKQLADARAGSSPQLWEENFYLNKREGECADWENQKCNYILIKGKVLLCGTTIGVPNVSVTLTRGHTATTDQNGNFTITSFDDTLNPQRVDQLYYNSNSCFFTDCNGSCIDTMQVVIQKCSNCDNREVDVADTSVKYVSLRGLLSGTTYPVGVTGWDWLGRVQFVQPLGNITTPSVQETKVFAPSSLQIDIDPTAVFPTEFDHLSFWIGSPAELSEYITWIVDSVTLIDNTGIENKIAPTQIKIGYASLIEYNKQNNFNTTVNWQFLAPLVGTEVTQAPYTTDKVQFLLNGDGTFFSKAISQLVKYDQTGKYFLINYTDDLKNLKENAIIRIVRPKVCSGTEPYYEVCSRIKLVNGKSDINSFILNAFDTYYLNRSIPVPVQVGDETVNELRQIGVPFEHDSPSDFWGKGCHNIGRVNVANPQETELYHPDQMGLSGAMSVTGQLNFLNTFDEGNKVDFSKTQINGIISSFSKPSRILVIGQNGHFIVGYDDNLIRINADGTAQAGSTANGFGQPQVALIGYGCQQFDKNTIYEKDGLVQWLDTSMSFLIQHNFQTAIQVSQTEPSKGIPGGVDSWLRPKIKEIQRYNNSNTNKRYWHGCVNPISNEYILTDKIIKSNDFVNQLREKDIMVQETYSMNVNNKLWLRSYGFTPEYYSELEGELDSQAFFSFVNGVPHSHYNNLSVKNYGKIYSQIVNRTYDLIIVIDPDKKKRPLSIGVLCKQSQYFSDKTTTESGQETRILLSQWLQANYSWWAPVLCDLNTPYDLNVTNQTGINKLYDGNTLIANWIRVRLIGDPGHDTDYSELQSVTYAVFGDGNNLLNQ